MKTTLSILVILMLCLVGKAQYDTLQYGVGVPSWSTGRLIPPDCPRTCEVNMIECWHLPPTDTTFIIELYGNVVPPCPHYEVMLLNQFVHGLLDTCFRFDATAAGCQSTINYIVPTNTLLCILFDTLTADSVGAIVKPGLPTYPKLDSVEFFYDTTCIKSQVQEPMVDAGDPSYRDLTTLLLVDKSQLVVGKSYYEFFPDDPMRGRKIKLVE